MKLRMLDSSVRLRLSRPEVELIARGVRVQSRAVFPNGEVFSYALSCTAGDAVTARFEDCCIEVKVPRQQLVEWAQGDVVTIAAEEATVGGSFRIVIEKDFTCLHPREDEPVVESFPNPRAATIAAPVQSRPTEPS